MSEKNNTPPEITPGDRHPDYKGEIAALGGIIDGAEYGADIRLDVSLPGESVDALASRLTELSAGGLTLALMEESYRPGPREEL